MLQTPWNPLYSSLTHLSEAHRPSGISVCVAISLSPSPASLMHTPADRRTHCFDSHVVSLYTHHVFFTLPSTDAHMGWLVWYSRRYTVLSTWMWICLSKACIPSCLDTFSDGLLYPVPLLSLMFIHEFSNVFGDGATSLHFAATVQILLTWCLWYHYWGLVEPWRAAA